MTLLTSKFITTNTLEQLFNQEASQKYQQAQPYPHVVIDNFLNEEIAEAILEEFHLRNQDSIYYHHFNERKAGYNNMATMGSTTTDVINELNSAEFVAALATYIGKPGLVHDPDLDGGGLHEMKRGGFLNIHTDFQSHTTQKNWSREANLLIFFNKDWKDDYNGCLELWDTKVKTCVQKIKPIFNRCVIFSTSNVSYHGVPDIIQCPENDSRKSMALYYFKENENVCRLKPTGYRPRPEDSLPKKTAIYIDRSMVWVYSFIKRYLGVHEAKFSKILKKISKK